MEQFVRVTNGFDAHHQLVIVDRPRCQRNHGHHWTVEVEKQGADQGLEDDVAALLMEFADRSLNEMVPVPTSPEQLSVLFMERLLLQHPKIVMVSVSDGRLTGIARNTPR